MLTFTIDSSNVTSNTDIFLTKSIQGFYHSDYSGGGKWQQEGTIENIICTLKNDITPYTNDILTDRCNKLSTILKQDLPQIQQMVKNKSLTVCVVPRAKVHYSGNQLLFKKVVKIVISQLPGFHDGVDYIQRHTDTQTTHRARVGYGGSGMLPYPGITKNTCTISNEVSGKDILLIDDLYTKTVNIDEDAIQALIDNGANSVVFYAIGKTLRN